MTCWARVCRGVGVLGLVCAIVGTCTPLPNALFRWSATPADIQPADAVVALGAAIDPDGTLSWESLVQALKAISLFREGRAGLVVFSGPSPGRGPSEAEVRADLARAMGVPSTAILTESAALTTREEAVRIAATLHARGARRVLLVTDSQHMRRGRALFERAGLQVFAAPADARSGSATSSAGRLRLVRDVCGEWLAAAYYRLAGYL